MAAPPVAGLFRLELPDSRSTGDIPQPLEALIEYLGRAMDFPAGALLMTGTGVVPDPPYTLRPDDLVRIDGGSLGVLEKRAESVG